MNYRRLVISNNIDKDLESILYKIGKWHNLTPKQWRPEYRVSDSDIEESINRIKNTKDEDLYIAIAEDDKGELQGFLWAYKQEKPRDSVMILSLYTTKDYRNCGVGTKLKLCLEEWCQQEGIKTIQTTVHYNNHNMMKLNQKLGYTPGMVSMTKQL